MISVGEGAAHLYVWDHAVQVQLLRIMSPSGMPTKRPETEKADAYLFVLALRSVRRAAELVADLTTGLQRDAIEQALSEFDAAFPTAKDIRDVLDRFDDYALGHGKLQDEIRAFSTNEWYERGTTTYRLSVGVDGKVLSVEITAAARASQALRHAVVEALS